MLIVILSVDIQFTVAVLRRIRNLVSQLAGHDQSQGWSSVVALYHRFDLHRIDL